MKTPNLPDLSWARATALAAVLGLGGLLAAVPVHATGMLDDRIDIRVDKADAVDLFKTFAQLTGLKLDIDPAVQGNVSLVLERVRLETALNAATESAGCRWEIADGKLRVEPLPGTPAPSGEGEAQGGKRDKEDLHGGLDSKIDLRVTKANAADLMRTFAELLSARLDLDPAVAGTVTLNLDDVACRDALNAACRSAGCSWKLLPGAQPTLEVKAGRQP